MASGPGPSAAPSTMRLEQAGALSYEARWLVDLRGRVMHASPAVHMLIGKSFAECSGRNMAELLLLPAAQAAQIEQCVANGTPFVDRVRLGWPRWQLPVPPTLGESDRGQSVSGRVSPHHCTTTTRILGNMKGTNENLSL